MEERENKEGKTNIYFCNSREQNKEAYEAGHECGWWNGFSIGALAALLGGELACLILRIRNK